MPISKSCYWGHEHDASSYRSGLEDSIAEQLRGAGVPVCYEQLVIRFTQPSKECRYTPDFYLWHNGIIIETKGRFVTADRKKTLLVLAEHPDLDIRFVFSNAKGRISKKSATTYAMWCEKNSILYAHRRIPDEWIAEEADPVRIAAAKKYLKEEKEHA